MVRSQTACNDGAKLSHPVARGLWHVNPAVNAANVAVYPGGVSSFFEPHWYAFTRVLIREAGGAAIASAVDRAPAALYRFRAALERSTRLLQIHYFRVMFCTLGATRPLQVLQIPARSIWLPRRPSARLEEADIHAYRTVLVMAIK